MAVTGIHLAQPVAVAAAAAAAAAEATVITDSMDRHVSNGWGKSANGVVYTVNNASRFAVSGGLGKVDLAPGKNSYATAAVNKQDVQAGVDVSFDSLPTAGSAYAHLVARNTNNGEYAASLRLVNSGRLVLELTKTTLGTKKVISSKDIAAKVKPGSAFHIDLLAQGNSPTDLKARAFVSGAKAPAWQISVTEKPGDEIKGNGNVRVGGYLSRSAVDGSGLHYDNVRVASVAKKTELPDIGEVPGLALPSPSPSPPVTDTPPLEQPNDTVVPKNALYVSASGNDSSNGSASSPIRSLSRATSKASNGQTIVVRGGTYHETVVMPAGKTLHLRNYPGETVWMDGSETVTGFVSASKGWVKNGWDVKFDTSPTFTRGAKDSTDDFWGFVNAKSPLAAHPDQVWIDGSRQDQVGSLAQLKAGTFFVDTGAKKLYVGSNPTGTDVRASTLVKALSIRGDKSTVQGINVRKYSPSVPDMGAVTAEKPGVVVKNLTIEDAATTGLNVSAVNNTILNVKIRRSGMLGMNAVYSDGLNVNNLISTDNNVERFNTSPVSGGFKIGRSRGVSVKNSQFLRNYGPGLWLDESVYDSKIVNNDMIDNSGHGLSLEISAKVVVANNRILDNAGNAIKLNDTSDVSIWNNTISGKNRALNIVQDARRGANKSDPGHDPRQAFPDPTMTWVIKNIDVKNNVLSNTGGGNAILGVEDFSGKISAEQMKISMGSNAYHRTAAGLPKWSVVWSKGSGNPSVYTTLTDFAKAKPVEKSSFEITSASVIGANQEPTSAVTSKSGQATALPSNIAQQIGQETGSKRIGNYPR